VEFAPGVGFGRRRSTRSAESRDRAGKRPLLLVQHFAVEIADGKQVLAGSGGGQQEDCET
jgi:hypothetical protein